MRNVCLVSILALLTAAPAMAGSQSEPPAERQAQAQAQATARPTYTAAQFYQTTNYLMGTASGLPFSPDGRSVLVTSDQSGVFNVYAVPVDGSTPVALTTSTTDANFGETYLPDGRVIIIHDTGGNELSHVYVREADGALRDLTPGDAVKADILALSPDGKTLWITSNARDPEVFDVLSFDTASLEGRMVFENPGMLVSGVSRDSRWIALTKPKTSADSDVYLVDLQSPSPAPRLITEHQGNIAHNAYAFSPDSKSLVYGTDGYGEFNQAWTYDLTTGETTPLIQADWDVMYVSYSPSGRYRVSAINADASAELTILDTQTDRPVTFRGLPEGSVEAIRFSPDERLVAFRVASDTTPGDVYVASMSDTVARRLATALNPEIDQAELVQASIIRFTGAGDVQIPGVLYRPRGASAASPVPAIVLMHGGPGGQSMRGYDAEVQHLVNHGYAVLLANNRGSSGYGKTFFHMDDRKHGEGDLQDVVDAGQWLRDQGWVADDQVAVMGGSYGGYLVAAALTFHPEAFEAGVNVFGVTNWVRTLESIPAWWGAERDALFDEMGDPATDAERHRRISPLFHADRIRRPLLVVQGANDPRVLQVESDELVAAVRANNVPVEYVLFPDEGHGFLKRENRIAAQEAYLAFLDRYVRD